jgi:hypothetical protein
MGDKILFVEGQTDEYFIKQLIKIDKNLSELEIQVEPTGGVQKEIQKLEDTNFLQRLKTNDIDRLGIIADADYANVDKNSGFNNRWNEFSTILQNEGYSCEKPTKKWEGSLFQNKKSKKIGLWLMPNHFEDGYLEKLILDSIDLNRSISNGDITQNALLKEVDNAIKKLADNELKAFEKYHDSKAKAFTWLAWQKKPRHFIGDVIDANEPKNNLIKVQHKNIQALVRWLKTVFE